MEELIQQLEAKYGKTWSIWRTYDGRYVCHFGPDRECLDADGLLDVIKLAIEFRKMEKYHRQPLVPSLYRYGARKDGSNWTMTFDGQSVRFNFPTKKSVMEAIERHCKRQTDLRDQWDETVGPLIHGKIEGVDYIFVDY